MKQKLTLGRNYVDADGGIYVKFLVKLSQQEMEKIAGKLKVPPYCYDSNMIYSYWNEDKTILIDPFGIDFKKEKAVFIEKVLNELGYKIKITNGIELF